MNQELINPEMVNRLNTFFPDICTIQEYTQTYNSVNEPVKNYEDKFANIACAVAKDTTQEVKSSDGNVRTSTHRIVLMKFYNIDKTMRVLLNGEYFDILHVQHDQMSMMTSLVCEKVRL